MTTFPKVLNAANPALARTAIAAVGKGEMLLNILDFGVTIGTSSSQTSAIKTALDANPGAAFFFPPGDYRLDASLAVSSSNSLILAAGARVYAHTAMTTLIDYDNGAADPSGYVEDHCISGYGILDGNLAADNVLRVANYLRFTVEGLTISDGINRGILADAAGAELHVRNVRIRNTGTTNVSDNIGIEANCSDARFSNLSMRDLTTAVWDKGGNYWIDIHPWLGALSSLTARYQNSVAFLLQGDSVLIAPYADTYRYSFKTAGTFARAIIVSPKVYCNNNNLSDGLAASYPGVVFDFTASSNQLISTQGVYLGHPVTAFAFTVGNTSGFNSNNDVAQNVTGAGAGDYRDGVQLGYSTFTPTLYGATTAGTQVYTAQVGQMEVRGNFVTYIFRIACTMGATANGIFRIGGFPLPPGASSVDVGVGSIAFTDGGVHLTGLHGANGTTAPLVAIPYNAAAGSYVDASGFQSVAVAVEGSITCRYDA